MPNNPTQSTIYESYTMLHPDGTLMCRCNKKRADWYVNRELATWVNDTTFQLTFEPQGHGKAGSAYYNQKLENKCVVCGKLAGLNKHHVFPYVFRSRLPIQYKESNHHDILPICTDCHEDYEAHATRYKIELAEKYDIRMNGVMSQAEKTNRKIISARKILSRLEAGEFVTIPTDRLTVLREQAAMPITEEVSSEGAVWADKIMERITNKEELHNFIRSWREHFIQYAQPQYLPELWSVDHPLEIIGRYQNTESY